MKTAIIYASVHHGNTKKIIDEIARTNEVDLIENKNVFLMCTYGEARLLSLWNPS